MAGMALQERAVVVLYILKFFMVYWVYILLSGNTSKVTYFKVGQIFKEKQNKVIYLLIYNNNSYKICVNIRYLHKLIFVIS